MVANNWSRFVLVVWLFMMFVLMQSFTANLSSMLTIDRLEDLQNKFEYVGYQEGSFVRNLLINRLNFNESKLRKYSTVEEYHDALSIGSNKGGVDAIFDEIPYMKLFLHRYPSKYKMVGATYKTDGFGFAFPLGSPLVPHFSKAVLKVTQDPNMSDIEERNFGVGYSSEDLNNPSSYDRLSAHSFGGLFIITGFLTILALVCSESSFGRRLVEMANLSIQKCYLCLPSSWIDSIAHTTSTSVENVTPDIQLTHSPNIDQNGDENGSTEIEREREREDDVNTNDPNEQEQHT